MAVLDNGIFGNIRQSMNGVTFSTWKGINTARKKVTKISNPQTAGQVENRSAFKTCSVFAASILASLIIPLMNRFAKKMSGYNMFTSLNKQYFGEEEIIAPASINFGKGKLGSVSSFTAIASDGIPECVINWDASLDNQYKLDTDKAYAMIVNITDNTVVYQGDTGAVRSDDNETLTTTEILNPAKVYWAYLVFQRADGTIIGNTNAVLVAPAP